MEFTIQADVRTDMGRKTDALRAEGKIPSVVYGFGIEPTNLTVDRNAMERAYRDAGESTILKLDIAGAVHDVLIQDLQRDPLTGFLTHADFRKVDMSKKVEATIELKFVGEAPAVKELGGTLVESIDEVEVEALPSALVREITVDVSSLKTFDEAIRVKDLQVPAGVEILNDAEETVASVQPPRSEEELAALDNAVEMNVDSVQVTTEKKDEATGGEEKKK